ncbi:MAG: hypothetical protein V1492_02170 [Candidatus Micrarchaeota archaeon]
MSQTLAFQSCRSLAVSEKRSLRSSLRTFADRVLITKEMRSMSPQQLNQRLEDLGQKKSELKRELRISGEVLLFDLRGKVRIFDDYRLTAAEDTEYAIAKWGPKGVDSFLDLFAARVVGFGLSFTLLLVPQISNFCYAVADSIRLGVTKLRELGVIRQLAKLSGNENTG